MHKLAGQVFVLFVIVVAAAEAAVGLAIIILTARNRQSLNVERVDLLKL
jgi:NADH-quinone oxidoreductase subunit K